MICRKKILKPLFKKFKWNFLVLFLLVFLDSYLAFLIIFNFRQNLSYDSEKRGWFYYLFGKHSVIQETQGTKIYVNWNKLLFILLFLYFPLRIIIKSTLKYLQSTYSRKATVFLTKELLDFAYQHKDLITKKQKEKIYIVNHFVPIFARQLFVIIVRIFHVFVDFIVNLFWFYILIKFNELFYLTPFIFAFVLINLFWLILFEIFTKKIVRLQKKKTLDYQEIEENQIEFFLKSLNNNNQSMGLKKVHRSLDKNSQKLSSLRFVSLFLDLPYLIISGLHLLFLFLYCKVFLGGQGGLGWELYFVALAIRSIFFLVRRTFELLPTISSFLKNYKQIKSFFA